MNLRPYDPGSAVSILEHARQLSGRTLAEVVNGEAAQQNLTNKGDLGGLVEKLFFRISPDNTSSLPDFPDAGVELKTTGVVRSSSKHYQAKERLVLTIIDYLKLVDETWETSSFLKKCRLMLILFYLYERELPVMNRRFVLEPLLFEFPEQDIEVIRRDWEKIRLKVAEGKAHELSEGDTFYLAAARKGSGGPNEPLRRQPNSGEPAKQRAFSLKKTYVDQIIQGHIDEHGLLGSAEGESIEEATARKLQKYLGRRVNEISTELNYEKSNDKAFLRHLSARMLGFSTFKIPEFEKAGIEMKTIRVNKDWVPRESMSFPGFKYLDIIKESWDESMFSRKLEQKFLFVIFRYDESKQLRFANFFYWNMPFEDRQEARRVWERTKSQVAVDASTLPRESESHVAHVRPKGRNAADTIPTPQGTFVQKKCFWLNRGYIGEVIAQQKRVGNGLADGD